MICSGGNANELMNDHRREAAAFCILAFLLLLLVEWAFG